MLHTGKAVLTKTVAAAAFRCLGLQLSSLRLSSSCSLLQCLRFQFVTAADPASTWSGTPLLSIPSRPAIVSVKVQPPAQVRFLHKSIRLLSDDMADNKFAADYAKMGTSGCKKCKQKLAKGSFRLAKVVSNPFSEEGGDMKQYHHPRCIFETFVRARATTKIIEDPSDITGYENLEDEDKTLIKELIKETMEKRGAPKKTPTKKGKSPAAAAKAAPTPSPSKPSTSAKPDPDTSHISKKTTAGEGGSAAKNHPSTDKDNSFRQFRRVCADIAEESSYLGKTAIVSRFITKGSSGEGYHGDTYLMLKLLLPGVVKTVYNLNSKQLVKIFSKILGASESAMVEDLEQGDVAETLRIFFENSKLCPPHNKSTLSIIEVDRYLTNLAKYTKEDDQQTVLSTITKRCTGNDLKMVIRLIKHDLRINSGAKHILDALDPNAYEAFQVSRDLRDVVDRVDSLKDSKPGLGGKKLSVRANLMTPILPMLAEACKSVDYAFKKCPNGMYAEIKYDGERVQVHKQGDDFSYFSRSLKPVLPHKVAHFKDYIPKAFKHGNDLILDAEVLLIDTKTSKPLPFGTLGVHKKAAFQDANVCLFIFDCIHYNGQNLLDKPIKQRRKFLQENMTEVPNRILFSEMKHVTKTRDLSDMMMKVFREGLEGLVLKDVNSLYEPGKRHWLKVKKDYLAEGAMADTADLVVLGAYFGTGNKGGLMSIFLMGVWDPATRRWCTVTKCGSGFDDATLNRLQKDFDMVKISKDYTQVPSWLNINRNVTPDFVVKDPKASQVWEITGAEFSKAEIHTAGGISIRFPRCTKMRDDKTWKEATTLSELRELFRASKETSDMPDLLGGSTQKATPTKNKAASNGRKADDTESNGESMATTTPRKRKSAPTEEESTPVSKKAKSEGDNSHKSQHLPNVFSGMKLYLPTEIHDYEKMKRYIIAFDGDVVSEHEKDSATHIVVWNGPMSTSSSQRHVTGEWVWRCIKKKKLVPYKGSH